MDELDESGAGGKRDKRSAGGKKPGPVPRGKSRIRGIERNTLRKRGRLFFTLRKAAFTLSILPVGLALYEFDRRTGFRITMGLIAIGLIALGAAFWKAGAFFFSKADSLDTRKSRQ